MIDPILIYLAGPIDEVTTDRARGWREVVSAHAGEGVVFFSPAHAYLNAGLANAPMVDMASRHVIHCAQGMLANLSDGSRGFGTIREIEFARARGKPVAVVGQIVSLLAHDCMLASSLEEGMDLLLQAIQDHRDRSTITIPLPRGFLEDLEEGGPCLD